MARVLTDEEQWKLVDTLSHELALAYADEVVQEPMGVAEAVEIAQMDRAARSVIQGRRREAFDELRRRRSGSIECPIPPEIMAMSRAELLFRFRQIERRAPEAFQVEFRRLKELTEDELRVVLMDVEDVLGELDP